MDDSFSNERLSRIAKSRALMNSPFPASLFLCLSCVCARFLCDREAKRSRLACNLQRNRHGRAHDWAFHLTRRNCEAFLSGVLQSGARAYSRSPIKSYTVRAAAVVATTTATMALLRLSNERTDAWSSVSRVFARPLPSLMRPHPGLSCFSSSPERCTYITYLYARLGRD